MRATFLPGCCALAGALIFMQTAFAQAPRVEDLAAMKALQSAGVTFKRSLKLPAGELSVGDDAARIPPASLQTTYKLDAAAFTPGVVTLCPTGTTDNQAKAGCRIVGIVNSYPVNANNVERWVAETKGQLIGNAAWFMAPENRAARMNELLRLARFVDPAFEGCITRLAQTAEGSAEACFKTRDNNERTALYLKLCRSSINGIRGDLIVTVPDVEPDYCAIDPKSGLATTLTFDQRNGRIGVAIMTILPVFEAGARADLLEKKNQQQNFKAPGRL